MDIKFPQPLTFYAGTTGLNNRVDPMSIEDTDLALCENFIIDEAGLIHTLFSYNLLHEGHFLGATQNPNLPYVIVKEAQSASIYYVNDDLTLTLVKAGLSLDAPVSFTEFRGYVYFSNGHQNGRIKNKTYSIWPERNGSLKDRRVASSAPIGNHIENYNGLMVISVGPTLYFSLDGHSFILHENFIEFPKTIIMVRGTPSGLFISTTEKVYYIAGALLPSSSVRTVSQTPAIEWSDSAELVDGADLNLEANGLCALWACTDSACIGLPNGEVQKINKVKIRYPQQVRQSSSLLVNKTFIHSF